MISDFTIIIDSRENLPYDFKLIKPEPITKRRSLKTGDYSIKGLEDKICCERKTISDFLGSVGCNRQRFEKEFQRMAEMQYAALVLEFDFKTLFLNPPARSKMNVKAAFRTVISWSVKYNVCIWPMFNRESAEKITYLILEKFYNEYKNNLDK